MNENSTPTVQTVTYGTVFLSCHPQDSRFLCWRNMEGKRVSRYYSNEADALYYCAK